MQTRGVDVVPSCVESARKIANDEGVESLCEFIVGDCTTGENVNTELLEEVTVVYLYCYPTLLKKMDGFIKKLVKSKSIRAIVTQTYHVSEEDLEKWGAEIVHSDDTNQIMVFAQKTAEVLPTPLTTATMPESTTTSEKKKEKKKKKKQQEKKKTKKKLEGGADEEEGDEVDDETLEQPEMNKITGATGLTDEETIAFLTRIDRTGPEQCLRYSRWNNER